MELMGIPLSISWGVGWVIWCSLVQAWVGNGDRVGGADVGLCHVGCA